MLSNFESIQFSFVIMTNTASKLGSQDTLWLLGCQVVVSLNQSFQVGNHDFSCFSLIPSVNLEVHIPDSIDGSWYQGKVFIGFKDAAFEVSSPVRHAIY